MKNFFLLLAKGIGIALLISLTVCFFAWYWGNWRAVAWYVFGALIIWQVYKYFKTPIHHAEIKDDAGNVLSSEHVISVTEKLEEIIGGVFWMALAAVCFYGIGRLFEWLFDCYFNYFELTILFGFIIAVLSLYAYGILRLMYYAIKELDWKYFVPQISNPLKWVLIIFISVGVGIAVLYYGLPSVS